MKTVLHLLKEVKLTLVLFCTKLTVKNVVFFKTREDFQKGLAKYPPDPFKFIPRNK